jgi:formylglycine-generating enzyme required for sulfatase activity
MINFIKNIIKNYMMSIMRGKKMETNEPVAAPEGFVFIQGGTFTMGSPDTEAERRDDEVRHQVTVSSFYMGKNPVTLKEWDEIMGSNLSANKYALLPVDKVSWYDAVRYCNARSLKEGLTTAYTIDTTRDDPNNKDNNKKNYGEAHDYKRWLVRWNRNATGYRLPTEAEWEYACRAGTTTPFYTGNTITTHQANYDGRYPYNSNYDPEGTFRNETIAVGSYAPNAWGLYDMPGNVCEWCWDWYGDYSSSAQTDPAGAGSGAKRVIRGGGYMANGRNIRSADRSKYSPDGGNICSGFRVVRSAGA